MVESPPATTDDSDVSAPRIMERRNTDLRVGAVLVFGPTLHPFAGQQIHSLTGLHRIEISYHEIGFRPQCKGQIEARVRGDDPVGSIQRLGGPGSSSPVPRALAAEQQHAIHLLKPTAIVPTIYNSEGPLCVGDAAALGTA